METFRQQLSLSKTVLNLVFPIIVTGLLSGCTKPLVNVEVNVDTCQAGGPRTPLPGGIGACNNGGTGPIVVSNSICKDSGGKTITCQSSFQCTAGNKCLDGNPGNENRKLCKTKWTQTSGNNGNCLCNTDY
jgi:hypothetical protein